MRRVLIAVLVLVVLSPTMALAAAWYRCRADGQVRSACCCSGAASDDDAPAGAPSAVQVACCCTIEPGDEAATQTGVVDAGAMALAVVPVPRAAVEVQAPDGGASPRPTPGVSRPSSRAPPLFLAHCSLLL